MGFVLSLLCVLCAARVHGIFDGTCPRKDPPPGVLVLTPGSKLVLTCRGHVMVNGETVDVARNNPRTNRGGSVAPTTHGSAAGRAPVGRATPAAKRPDTGLSTVTGETRRTRRADTGFTATPGTSPHSAQSEETNSEADYGDYEGGEEEEEGEDGNRVTRGVKSRPQWKWNGKTVGKGSRDWGGLSFERRGAMLSLSSVRTPDSGNYTCHHRGLERFALKVVVADPPSSPSLTCYKRSPSSKIRCESETQKPTAKPLSSFLILNKRTWRTFRPVPCSYSSRLSRYWCALENEEDELRTTHRAYLCVTGLAGNATSSLLTFSPLAILKPDPPSGIRVHPIEGRRTYLRVSWSNPTSWKSQDNYYKLIYELKYKPLESSVDYEQTVSRTTMRVDITDVMPGVEYQIQVRAKDEYDGQWSVWSPSVSGRSWTEPRMASTTPEPTDINEGGSGDLFDGTTAAPPPEDVSYRALWISGSCLLLSLILVVYYMLRHKPRFMLKLHHLNVFPQHSDPSPPPAPDPPAPEVQALVTFGPPRYKEPPLSNREEAEEENEEEQRVQDGMDAVHFNNTSYFLLQTG